MLGGGVGLFGPIFRKNLGGVGNFWSVLDFFYYFKDYFNKKIVFFYTFSFVIKKTDPNLEKI